MKKALITAIISAGLVAGTAAPVTAATYATRHQYIVHKRHMRTAKRVAIGAAGGAVVGGLAAGGKGAAIGALAGGGAGYLWDRHKRHKRHY